jgi:hypothetical protein
MRCFTDATGTFPYPGGLVHVNGDSAGRVLLGCKPELRVHGRLDLGEGDGDVAGKVFCLGVVAGLVGVPIHLVQVPVGPSVLQKRIINI